jgi:LacI family transcriptional regulator
VERKISLKDVAKHLGVSTALVSYVVNNKEKEARVSAAMAKKIRKAIQDLNYQPNQIAKSLKHGKTHTIGLIVADISNPFFSNIARIIEDEAKKHGYVVIFGSSDENAEKSQDLINVLLNRQVDAFIIAPAANTEKQIKDLKKKNVPLVLIDRYFKDVDADMVHTNNFQASYKAVEHLIKNGRRKIGMVAYDTDLPHMQERINGYKEALRTHGIRFKKTWLQKSSFEMLETQVPKSIETLIDAEEIDAMLFATNSLAVAGIKKMIQMKIRVPEQVAIISFDQSDAFDFFHSPISYVNQSIKEIGEEAVKLVINMINSEAHPPSRMLIESKLVVRESSGNASK